MSAFDALIDAHKQRTNWSIKAGAAEGVRRIVRYGIENNYSKEEIAMVLGETQHETAEWYQPIREGARKYGTNYTDAQSQRAIAVAVERGLIRYNYAKPHNVTGKSYYGRGLVQITHYDMYVKFAKLLGVPLDTNPDLTLEWDNALFIMFVGMRDGLFTSLRMAHYVGSPADMKLDRLAASRAIINGDAKRNGMRVAKHTLDWYDSLSKNWNALVQECQPAPTNIIEIIINMILAFLGRK